jgi:hypothetical protein
LVVWRHGLPRGRDANDDGAAGSDGAALDGSECFVEADFDGCEVIVSTAYGEALAGNAGVLDHEKIHDLVGGHGGLLGKSLEFAGHGNGLVGGPGGGEEGIGGEAGASAVGAPLVLEKALVGVDVLVGGGIGGAGGARAVFGIGAVVVLGPEAMKDEGGVRGALGSVGVGVAELRGPGEVEEVVVEAGAGGEGALGRG